MGRGMVGWKDGGMLLLGRESPSIKILGSCSSGALSHSSFSVQLELASGSLGLCVTKNLSNDVWFCLHFNTCLK